MIKSVIVPVQPSNNNKRSGASGESKSHHGARLKLEASSSKYDGRSSDKSLGHRRGNSSDPATSSSSHKSSSSSHTKKHDSRDVSSGKERATATSSGLADFAVTSIDLVSKLKWPANSVRYTTVEPTISFSCNPSFYEHDINLSKEAEKHRNNLFIISDVLDEIIDVVEYQSKRKSRKHKRSSTDKSSHKKSKKKRSSKSTESVSQDADKAKATGSSSSKKVEDSATANTSEKKPSTSGKKKRKKKHRKRTVSAAGQSSERPTSQQSAERVVKTPTLTKAPSKTPTKTPTKEPAVVKTELLSPTINSENVKVEKQVKRLKKLKKKVLNAGPDVDKPAIPAISPVKKPKNAAKPNAPAVAEQSQAKITIAFSQNSGKLSSNKSKWDSSSDEEGSSRKGAISYRFSEESDTEKADEKTKNKKKLPGSNPFAKMQSGGMLKTIEMHNPLPDAKPSVPLAHPNPGPDRTSSKSRSRSRSQSHSKSRSRSRSSSYSSDDSHHRSRRRRRGKRRRRSYTKSYSRSRSRSYSTSRSRSRSYSRSYSRSSSRSRSRYRSYSRSSYSSYSSRSYSSRSRSRSPRYTRAVQPKYNNTRAYNLGKRKKFKKKNQFKNQNQQNPHQNPNIQKQLETGRAKAEETVMRLKKQKEEQQDLQKRAMASIAAAASSAGIPMPTTTAPPVTAISTMRTNGASPSHSTTGTTSVTTTTPTPSVQHMNGATDLVNSYEDASRKASAPDFVPRSIQSREFIGPVRPGMDSDIPLPSGTPGSSHPKDIQPALQEPRPMEAPDQNDEAFRELQEQAKQHVQATNSSPASDQLQQLAMAQYTPAALAPEPALPMFAIDPLTGQHVQINPLQAAQIQQQQQLALAQAQAQAQQAQLQQQQTSNSPHSAGSETTGEDGKAAPHEAVVKSYAHQIFMSQQKALVSQSQPVFAMASSSSTTTVPQAGLPIQAATAAATNVPVQVTPAQAAQLQLQAQMQQMQQAQANAAAQAHAQAVAQAQAVQMQQIQQMQMAASLGMQPGLSFHHQLLAAQQQQQIIAQQQAQAQAAQGLQQLIQLPNGQVVVANQGAAGMHPLLLQRFARPM